MTMETTYLKTRHDYLPFGHEPLRAAVLIGSYMLIGRENLQVLAKVLRGSMNTAKPLVRLEGDSGHCPGVATGGCQDSCRVGVFSYAGILTSCVGSGLRLTVCTGDQSRVSAAHRSGWRCLAAA